MTADPAPAQAPASGPDGRRHTGALAGSFDRAARRYDLMVALNPGYHRHLRGAARRLFGAAAAPDETGVYADLGCGSGASTRALLDAARDAGAEVRSVVGVDASEGMLDEARRKSWPPSVRFAHTPAQDVAEAFGGARPDGVLAAYLFRNLTPDDRDVVLRRLRELIRPGGRLVVQDYAFAPEGSRAHRGARLRWSAVCHGIVIPLAAVLLRDTSLYRYLVRSALDFDRTDRFAARLAAAGFVDVGTYTVGGWQRGILHTFVGTVPPGAVSDVPAGTEPRG